MASAMRMVFLPCSGSSTPLLLFRSRLDSARQDGEHCGPCGDVLAQLRRVDLVERIVGRVVPVEIARAVLVERNPRRTGADGRFDIGAVSVALVVLGDAEGCERSRQPGIGSGI